MPVTVSAETPGLLPVKDPVEHMPHCQRPVTQYTVGQPHVHCIHNKSCVFIHSIRAFQSVDQARSTDWEAIEKLNIHD